MKSWEREYGGGEENKGEEKEKREGEGERRSGGENDRSRGGEEGVVLGDASSGNLNAGWRRRGKVDRRSVGEENIIRKRRKGV